MVSPSSFSFSFLFHLIFSITLSSSSLLWCFRFVVLVSGMLKTDAECLMSLSYIACLTHLPAPPVRKSVTQSGCRAAKQCHLGNKHRNSHTCVWRHSWWHFWVKRGGNLLNVYDLSIWQFLWWQSHYTQQGIWWHGILAYLSLQQNSAFYFSFSDTDILSGVGDKYAFTIKDTCPFNVQHYTYIYNG